MGHAVGMADAFPPSPDEQPIPFGDPNDGSLNDGSSKYDPLDPDSDCFKPPAIPTEVHCLHCGREYESYLIEWRVETTVDGSKHGFWCCPTPGCGGRGFGFDILPTDPRYVGDDGEPMFCWSDDEEDEYDEDDEELLEEEESDLDLLIDDAGDWWKTGGDPFASLDEELPRRDEDSGEDGRAG